MARRGGLDEGREVEKSMSEAFSAGKPSIGTRAGEERLFEEEGDGRENAAEAITQNDCIATVGQTIHTRTLVRPIHHVDVMPPSACLFDSPTERGTWSDGGNLAVAQTRCSPWRMAATNVENDDRVEPPFVRGRVGPGRHSRRICKRGHWTTSP